MAAEGESGSTCVKIPRMLRRLVIIETQQASRRESRSSSSSSSTHPIESRETEGETGTGTGTRPTAGDGLSPTLRYTTGACAVPTLPPLPWWHHATNRA